MNRKGIAIGACILVVIICAAGVWYFKHRSVPTEAVQQNLPTASSSAGIVQGSQSLPNQSVVFDLHVNSFHIFLSPANAYQETASGYCGADQGNIEYNGDYHLVSVNNTTNVLTTTSHPISDLDIGSDSFTANRPHNGLHEFTMDNGDTLIGIYQYGSCNTEQVQFYKVSNDGTLMAVNFLNKDGTTAQSEMTPPDGSIGESDSGDWVFCDYDNALGQTFCDSFAYNGKGFIQTNSWTGGGVNPQPIDEARRALIDYLTSQSQSSCGGGLSSNACIWLNTVQDETSTVPNVFLFTADFNQGDGTYTVNGKTEFQFKVEATGSDFTVLDPAPSLFNWSTLTPALDRIIASTSLGVYFKNGYKVNINNTYNITGDGALTALVSVNDDQNNDVGSASSPYYTLLRIQNNQPVPVLLKNKDGTISSPFFMMGSGGSGRYGEDFEVSSSTHTLSFGDYISYGTSSGDNADSCEGNVYQWNAQTGLFEYNPDLSPSYQQTYCHQVVQGLKAQGFPTNLNF